MNNRKIIAPGEQHGVLEWPHPPLGTYHVVRIRALNLTGTVDGEIVSCGFIAYEQAKAAAKRFNEHAHVVAEREAAGLCACGLPYEAHDSGHADTATEDGTR